MRHAVNDLSGAAVSLGASYSGMTMLTAHRPLPSWWAKSMLLAVILIVFAPDHWDLPLPFLHAHERAGRHQIETADRHGRHCHADAATCSDAPLVSATGIAVLAAWLGAGLTSGGRWLRLAGAASVPRGKTVALELRPPRSLHYGAA